MFDVRSTRRCFAALIAAIVALTALAVPPALGEDDGEIVLRLEDPSDGPQAQREVPVEPEPGYQPLSTPPPPDVKAASAVLMDARTGQIIYEKNAHVRRPNASTTKIMTAILLIEHCKMDDTIKASKKASETPYTSLNLRPGEKIAVKDLLVGLLVRSANDAAVAAAEHIAGSVSKFATMMNRKAAKIGCKNTHFVTPNGLHDKDHYSSAYDLCLMARYALKYPVFNEIITIRKHILNSRTINKKDLAVFSRCKFMKNYPGADGVKSGYVRQAGYCYVGSATRDGWRLVSSVLKSDNAGRDTGIIMDYAFNNFRPMTVAAAGKACAEAEIKGGELAAVPAEPAHDLMVVVPRSGEAQVKTTWEMTPLEAPIAKGAKVGTLKALVDGQAVATVDLCAAQDVQISFARKAWSWIRTCGILMVGLIGGRYGAAAAKGNRLRRRRVATILREPDR